MGKKISVLYVEDDQGSYKFIQKLLPKFKRFRVNLDWADTYAKALKLEKKNKYDLILLDYMLDDDKTALNFLEERKNNIPYIIFTKYGTSEKEDLFFAQNSISDLLPKDSLFLDTNKGCDILERSIFYSLEKSKMQNKIKYASQLYKMILNTTKSGICVLDYNEKKILDVNQFLIDMFDIDESNKIIGSYFKDIFYMSEYEKNYYQNNIIDIKREDEIFDLRANKFMEIALKCKINDKKVDCLLQGDRKLFINGVEKEILVLTFIDITEQKNIQNTLIAHQKKLQDLIEKYGIKSQNPQSIFDLAKLELEKFKNVEDI